MFNPMDELRERNLRELREAREAYEKELKEYPLAAYSTRALKDELKRRKGKRV